MAIAAELVTILRYTLDKSGLSEYLAQAKAAGAEVSSLGRAAAAGWREGVRDAAAEYGKTPAQMKRVIDEQLRLNREQKQSVRNVKEMGDGYRRLVGYLRAALGGVGIIGVARIADAWSGVEARIGLATDGIHEQQRAIRELYNMAQSAGSDFLAGGDLFVSISRNREQMGLMLDDSLKLTDTIAKLTAMGGGSESSKQAALIQLSQAMGLGVLRGQDLKSVQSQAPRLAQGIAEAFGVSAVELTKLGEQGKLVTREMAEGLLRISEKVNEEYARMPKTFGQGATLIRNEIGRIIWQQDRATAASQGFYAVSKLIAVNLTQIVKMGAMLLLTVGSLKLIAALRGILATARLIAARFVFTASVAGVWRTALASVVGVARRLLGPFVRVFAVLETIRLIGDDIITWLKGGRSITGGLIGRSEEWEGAVNRVRDVLAKTKELLTGSQGGLRAWVSKWVTLGTLALGLFLILRSVGKMILSIGGFLFRWLIRPLVVALAAIIGWPATIVVLVAALIAWLFYRFEGLREFVKDIWKSIASFVKKAWRGAVDWISDFTSSAFSTIGDFINGLWDGVVDYFKDKWRGALDWITDKFSAIKKILPDSWVLSDEEGSAARRERGERDPRLRFREPNMGLLQKQSFGGGMNNSGNVTVQTTIHTASDRPASVAQAASQAVKQQATRFSRQRFDYPNVEALA